MRLKRLLFLAFAGVTVSACFLPDSHCSGDVRVESSTPPLTGSSLDQWNHASCSTDEDSLCTRGLPTGNALELCAHDSSVVTTPAGPFMALRCHYYSTDRSCHSSSDDPD
jgi:hypothetical protein